MCWQHYFNVCDETAGKTEFYLMQLTAEVVKSNVKNPAAIDMNKFKLTFKQDDKPKFEDAKKQQEYIEQKTAVAKAKWGGILSEVSVVKHGE